MSARALGKISLNGLATGPATGTAVKMSTSDFARAPANGFTVAIAASSFAGALSAGPPGSLARIGARRLSFRAGMFAFALGLTSNGLEKGQPTGKIESFGAVGLN